MLRDILDEEELQGDLTFGRLLDAQQICNGNRATEINEIASKESKLEERLNGMKQEWNNLRFGISTADANDLVVLQIDDALKARAQKQISDTQLLMCSPCAMALKDELHDWLISLSETDSFISIYSQVRVFEN